MTHPEIIVEPPRVSVEVDLVNIDEAIRQALATVNTNFPTPVEDLRMICNNGVRQYGLGVMLNGDTSQWDAAIGLMMDSLRLVFEEGLANNSAVGAVEFIDWSNRHGAIQVL